MINTTIFKSAFILLVVLSFAIAHPVDLDVEIQSSKPSTTEETPNLAGGDHYDQRQNGTKNFRIHVDGVVLVVAPAEALLLAGLAGELDPSLLGGFGPEGIATSSKPGAGSPEIQKPPIAEEVQKPVKQKSANSHGLRLSNFLGPLVRRFSP